MTTTTRKLYSVGGYHPTTGEFAYSWYQCFLTRDGAESARRKYPRMWSMQEIIEHDVSEKDYAEVERFARENQSAP